MVVYLAPTSQLFTNGKAVNANGNVVALAGNGGCLLPVFLCGMCHEDQERDTGKGKKYRLGQTVVGCPMRFESLSAFFYMDGQGVYIWAAYGLTLVILAANILWPMMARRKIIRETKSAMLKVMNSRNSKDQP